MELTKESVNGDKTFYHAIIAQVKVHSTKNENEYAFANLDGWWDWTKARSMNGQNPELGKWYKVRLATKPKSQDAAAGAVYRDVAEARLAREGEIPDSPPEPASSPQAGSQSQPRPTRPDGDQK